MHVVLRSVGQCIGLQFAKSGYKVHEHWEEGDGG